MIYLFSVKIYNMEIKYIKTQSNLSAVFLMDVPYKVGMSWIFKAMWMFLEFWAEHYVWNMSIF